MEHPTALVVDDATTSYTCSCLKLRDAGWEVVCYACGRGVEGRVVITGPASPVVVQEAVWTDLQTIEAEDHRRHVGDRIRVAAGDGWLEDGADRYDEYSWSSIEPDDVARDDRLVDEVERRVA